MAESSVAALKRAGGRVWLAVAFASSVFTLLALRDGGQGYALILQALAIDRQPAGALHDAAVGPELRFAHCGNASGLQEFGGGEEHREKRRTTRS
jgi:hypothetical protein